MKIHSVKTVLPADEQNRFALHCATHTCYTQHIKLDCKVILCTKMVNNLLFI